MIERPGRIVAIHADAMHVAIDIASACSQCASKKACNGEVDQRLVELPLQPGLNPGDAVVLAMTARTLNQSALLIYLLPALSLILGALIGDSVGQGNVTAIFGAAVGLGTGLVGVRQLARLIPQNSLEPSVHACFQNPQHPIGSTKP